MTIVRAYAVELEGYVAIADSPDSVDEFLAWIKRVRQKRIADKSSAT
jgi:hypothetical protein